MTESDDIHVDTRAILGGRRAEDPGLAPSVHASSVFETVDAASAAAMATSSTADRFYSRHGNPSVAAFESAMADLEGAEGARAFASGMGAVSAVVLGICSRGDHIVTQRQLYAGTQLLFSAVCPRFGIDVSFVDAGDPDAWEAAIRPGTTMMCFAETPANPRLALVDLERFGSIAGPVTVVDSTLAPPVATRPLEFGAKLSLHSATKAIAGHNDATLGVVSGSRELLDWLWGFAVLQGATASPYDAVNALRGLRTLPVRFARQSQSALEMATFLESHPSVTSVAYPGLRSHPQHDLAARQMSANGGLITFDVAGGVEAGRRVVESTVIARLATSFGGPETLVTHPASTTHAGLSPEEREASGIGDGTIRMSVGLEHPADLIADIGSALEAGAESA
jgi:cystathionine beta-lyase/cystathionine gamma-synthase